MISFRSIDDYIACQPQEMREKLELIRYTIKKIVPDAAELISYGMPAFKYNGMLAWYAAFKKHYSLFFGAAVTAAFKEEARKFESSKGAIRIPYADPVPLRLLSRMTKFAAKKNIEKAKAKSKQIKRKKKK